MRLERQQQAQRAGWLSEDTPTISAQEKLQRPSMRPTRPPPAPPPLGSFAHGVREPTVRTSRVPPPLPPKRR